MPTALLMAYDKSGLTGFASSLVDLGWNLLGSRGTAQYLNSQSVPTRDIAELVGPPILGHKVVSLSRELFAALLADESPEEQAELERIGVPRIDLVYVNVYPLEEEARNPARTLKSLLEKTDIGGPSVLRAAAKGRRIVLCDQSQFEMALQYLLSAPHDEGANKKFIAGLVYNAESFVSAYCNVSARAQFEAAWLEAL